MRVAKSKYFFMEKEIEMTLPFDTPGEISSVEIFRYTFFISTPKAHISNIAAA
jgi:hypothetical protein